MKRLTSINDDGTLFINFDDDSVVTVEWLIRNKFYTKLKQIAAMLACYENLAEQGKLIKLPCKVGDMVYYLWKGEISEMEVTEISVGIEEPLYEMRYINNATRIHFYEEEFGQTIFHTPEEAEAALKKMEGENENNN